MVKANTRLVTRASSGAKRRIGGIARRRPHRQRRAQRLVGLAEYAQHRGLAGNGCERDGGGIGARRAAAGRAPRRVEHDDEVEPTRVGQRYEPRPRRPRGKLQQCGDRRIGGRFGNRGDRRIGGRFGQGGRIAADDHREGPVSRRVLHQVRRVEGAPVFAVRAAGAGAEHQREPEPAQAVNVPRQREPPAIVRVQSGTLSPARRMPTHRMRNAREYMHSDVRRNRVGTRARRPGGGE